LIALLSATWDEVTLLKKDIQVAEEGADGELKYKIGELYGQSVVMAVTGVGIRRARTGASFIIQKFKPRIIICAGHGGALSPDLKVGDIILGESVISLRKNEKKLLFSDLPFSEIDCKKGALLTESRFVHKPEEKRSLFEASGALAVDMETWGVVEAAGQSGIPVASVRSVSD
jgi:adenosylhomocysteine nucleosidase